MLTIKQANMARRVMVDGVGEWQPEPQWQLGDRPVQLNNAINEGKVFLVGKEIRLSSWIEQPTGLVWVEFYFHDGQNLSTVRTNRPDGTPQLLTSLDIPLHSLILEHLAVYVNTCGKTIVPMPIVEYHNQMSV